MLAAALFVLLAAPLDHSAFDALLREHVSEAGLVDYDAFARSGEFRTYLEGLGRASLEGRDDSERLAFWINVYNAWTIEQVNRHGERESIRNIRKTLGLLPLKGPWSERMLRAAGRELTLDEVEHEIVRKEFKEPRIHFALVCAALSCPPRPDGPEQDLLLSGKFREGRGFVRTGPSPPDGHAEVRLPAFRQERQHLGTRPLRRGPGAARRPHRA